MIDIVRAKKAFKEYVKKYNPDDSKVKLKIAHIERTAEVAKKLATELMLEKEDIELAELIGLLHDIGRFEQIRIYHTFVDKISIDHGKLGAKILFEDGLIRNFIEDKKYDTIIKKAIINHNKSKIEDGLDEKTNLHCKIIRDSDKLDIFYILTFENKRAVWESDDLSNDVISDEIYREFIEDKNINYKERKSSADILVSHFAYVYDFNFKYSLKMLRQSDNVNKLYKRFLFNDKKTMERYNNIYNIAIKYLKNSLEENN